MELLKDQHPQLQDCDGSSKFCRRVKSLITAMNSQTPVNSLKPDNEMYKVYYYYFYKTLPFCYIN